ncbi:MFS monosaccharide transporter [Lentinula aciculospora]|uniref:MFS monosaccharide transporter n=1 Tax=Lentinula aciculospora TaxID=153920 RepID=A0A9W9DQ46_9AGAR|nr:MFS monosaccharide transporter [Lentinula aciculospora]
MNAPGFENITAMGQELSPEQLALLCTTITRNWSWWEEDVDEDLARAIDFLKKGSKPTVHLTRHGGQITLHPDRHSYTYTYGSKGLAGLAHNRYALLCAIFASIGGLSFGYDQGVIANVLVMKDFMTRWPISPLEEGFMTAVLELGALIGALCAGIFADNYSRRFSMFVSCVIFCIGSAFQCGAQTLLHLFIGRAIGGVGVGALSTLSPLYMAEISPPEVRGSLMALEQFAIVLGVVLGFWLGYFTRNIPGPASWRIPLGVQIIPAIILILSCAFLPASPRLLVLQGKYDEALASLAQLRLRSPEEAQNDPLIQIEFLEMRVEATMVHRTFGTAENSKSRLSAEWGSWKRLLGNYYRDRTMVGVLMAFFQQWSGINALLYYGPILVRNIGLSGGNVTLLVSGGIGIVQFLAVLPVIAYIDQWGRRPLLRGGSIVMTFSHFSISILIVLFSSDWAAHSTAAWIGVGFVYLFTAAYGMSFGPVAWVLPSEVFPLSMRSKGVALSTASVWVNNFLIGLITPVTLEWSAAGTFMMFAAASFLAYIWVTYTVPETANVSLEEIDGMFKSSAGREEIIMKAQIEEDLGLRDLMTRLTADGGLNVHE